MVGQGDSQKLAKAKEFVASLANGLLHTRASWKLLFVAFVFVGSVLTLDLAGTVPPQNINVVDGQKYLSQSYAETPNATIGYNDNLSNWTRSSISPNATATIQTSRANLTLSGLFPPNSKAMSVTIQKNIFVNLNQDPLMYSYVNVSAGVQFGLRFFSTAKNGSLVPLWSNTDGLNHLYGKGQFQNIQANMLLLERANGVSGFSNVTRVQLYVERAPESYSTNFTLTMNSLKFLIYNIVPFQPTQSYHAVYFTFNGLPKTNSNWSLDKINLGMSLSASASASYTILQLNGTKATSGYNYQYSPSLTNYEYTLYPKNPTQIFTDSVPASDPGPNGASSNTNFTIVVIALSGTLSNVRVTSLSFVYTPSVAIPETVPLGGQYWYLYVLFFVFLLPLTIALLLYQEFRKDNFKPYYLALALAVGLGCRFALAPIASQPFDLSVYATSARGWFEYASSNASLGPTMPLTFFLYWIPYSFYGLLLKFGFHDFFLLNQQVGAVEMIFLKAFPILADVAIFFLFTRFGDSYADDEGFGKLAKIYAVIYFLNPLSIYISSVWGQYEASTIALVVLGFLYLWKHSEAEDHLGYLKSALAFVVSALIEVVGVIPLAFLFFKSLFTRPFDFKRPLLVLAPLTLFFIYPAEFHGMYLLFLSTVGASSTLLFSQPQSRYTIVSNFPQLLPYHPLLISLAAILGIFLITRDYSIKNVLGFTFLAFTAFLLFASQEPQWWLLLLPLGLLYAMFSGRYSLGAYMLCFGGIVAFLILTFTQGSGYILFGTGRLDIVPVIESVPHGINIYTLVTTAAVLLGLGYAVLSEREAFGVRTVLRSGLVLVGLLIMSFFWLSIMGVSL